MTADIYQIQFRRGTATEWAAANPVLPEGTPGFATDTNVVKIGDGVTPWNTLKTFQGPIGDKGLKGDKGDPGNDGADGVDGADGTDGLDGQDATISVGTVDTGAPGSSVDVVNVGTPTDAIFNFSIPEGQPGKDGKDGAAGAGLTIAGELTNYAALPTGLTTADAGKAWLIGELLYVWTGTAFPADGKGTEFRGPKGDKGDKGDTGVADIHGAVTKTTIVDADELVLADSEDTKVPFIVKKFSWATLKAALGNWFGLLPLAARADGLVSEGFAHKAVPTQYSLGVATGGGVTTGTSFRNNATESQYNVFDVIDSTKKLDINLRPKNGGQATVNADPIVTTTAAQTLTNKTFSNPTINSPTINSPTFSGAVPFAPASTLPNNVRLIGPGALETCVGANYPVTLTHYANDLAFTDLLGGTVTYTMNGAPATPWSGTTGFELLRPDSSQTRFAMVPTDVLVIEVSRGSASPVAWRHAQGMGISMSGGGYAATNVKMEVYDSVQKIWVTQYDVTNSNQTTHQTATMFTGYPTQNDITKLRWTLTNKPSSTPDIRISSIWLINYLSGLGSGVFLPRDGGNLYGTTASPPTISAYGGDANIDLALSAKGTGNVTVGGNPVVTTTAAQTLTNKTLDKTVTFNGVPLARMVARPPVTVAPGEVGDFAIDSNYLYVCYGSNAWGRVAMDTAW